MSESRKRSGEDERRLEGGTAQSAPQSATSGINIHPAFYIIPVLDNMAHGIRYRYDAVDGADDHYSGLAA
ncbi:hypothetical protein MGN70_003426 [Eutypa lata]|nr:hypothetical protein MGN70_003426 [Eutypa lata]